MKAVSTQIRLASYPVGMPEASDFDVVEEDLAALADGEVRLRTIYLSLDPYMRGRMSTAPSYAAPLALGDVVLGQTVSEVVESRSTRRQVGDIVLAFTGWQTQAVVDARQTRLVDSGQAPVSTALGVLGMPGFTGYAGLLEIGRPKPGETVVVAAAAGPVGSVVGQVARLKAARAVGIAGGQHKCDLLRRFGFDVALDHRSPTFVDDLAAATPDGVDVYFENVGGPVGAAVAKRLNTYARVPVCGLVADYNATAAPQGLDRLPGFMGRVLRSSLTVRGFIQDEFLPTHGAAFREDMTRWVTDGSVQYVEDVVDDLDNAVTAFQGLLSGRNVGKLLIRVAEDPTFSTPPTPPTHRSEQ